MRRNILILHNVPDLARGRLSTLDYIFAFERYAPDNNYAYHQISKPVPAELQRLSWDAAIFDSTSLGTVTLRPRNRFIAIRDSLRFLRDSDALKLVFPQDDATHSALLDQFFAWLKVDAVYSVRPHQRELLYPITSQRARFFSVLSGYVDDAAVESMRSFAKPFDERQWVVGQRVLAHPAWGGSLSLLKSRAAVVMKEECIRRGISCDVSTDPNDAIMGKNWHRFLADCRFVVGAEGGMSVWDPYGTINDAVADYSAAHPEATFEQIEDACFPGLDGVFEFPGVGPRLFEAAAVGCGQVLVEGEHRGLVRPWVHYIPLKRDFSNFDEVFAAMANRDRVLDMIAATQQDLVASPKFRYKTMVDDVTGFIDSNSRRTAKPTSKAAFQRLALASSAKTADDAPVETVALAETGPESGEPGRDGDASAAADPSAAMAPAAAPESAASFEGPPAPDQECVHADTSAAMADTVSPAHNVEDGEVISPDPSIGDNIALVTSVDQPEVSSEAKGLLHAGSGLAVSLRSMFIRRLGWIAAIGALVFAYPLGRVMQQSFAPVLGISSPPPTQIWSVLILSYAATLVALPARWRPSTMDSTRRAIVGAVLWAAAGYCFAMTALFLLQGAEAVGVERWPLIFASLALLVLGVLSVIGVATIRFISAFPGSLAGRCGILSILVVGLVVFLHPLDGAGYGSAALAGLFIAINCILFYLLVVRRQASFLRYIALAGPAWIVAAHCGWIAAVITLSDAQPARWLPIVTAALQWTIAIALPVAIRVLHLIRSGTLLYDPELLALPENHLELQRSETSGRRTAWVIAYSGVSTEPRLIRQNKALLDDGWRVVVCGYEGRSPRPPEWDFIRLAMGAAYRPYVFALFSRLNRLGRAMSRFGKPGRKLSRAGAHLRHFTIPSWAYNRSGLVRMLKENPDLKPDLIIAHNYYTADIAAALAKESGAKIVIDAHEYSPGEYAYDAAWVRDERPYVVEIEGHYMRKADLVVAVSDGIAEMLNRDYEVNRPVLAIRSIPFRNPQLFRSVGERIKVLYHGDISRGRFIHDAIESMQWWRPEFDLVLRGGGDPDYIASLIEKARELNVAHRVQLEPPVAFNDIVPAANLADIGYFSSDNFSAQADYVLPNKFFEYIQAGLALCVTDLKEMRRVTQQFNLGKLIPQHSARAIADTINSFTREDIEEYKWAALQAAEVLNWECEQVAFVEACNALFMGAEPASSFDPKERAVVQEAAVRSSR
ncbi:glycosyltransferase [Bosea sp. TWI1241]|uniref:glycosyltransferase n=1 Tax=Bosea sp. TWI1241 TaxID=3148904 RepID=UPI003209A88A